jgi:hypothetical protein
MFNPCQPCCSNCQIFVSVTDQCGLFPTNATITVTRKDTGNIIKTCLPASSCLISVPKFGWYTVKVTAPGFNDVSQDVYACPPCCSFFPTTLQYKGSVAQSSLDNYFDIIPVVDSEPEYTLRYLDRPAGIPKNLTTIIYDPSKVETQQDNYSSLVMPDKAWFSDAIASTTDGTPISVYFYLWFENCRAKVMTISVSEDGSEIFGAISGIVSYGNVKCSADCQCVLIPKNINLVSNENVNFPNASLVFQNTPGDILSTCSAWNIHLNFPSPSWYSDTITTPLISNGLGGFTQSTYRYWFSCCANIGSDDTTQFGSPIYRIAKMSIQNQYTTSKPKLTHVSSTTVISNSTNTCNPWNFNFPVVGSTTTNIVLNGSISPESDTIRLVSFAMQKTVDPTKPYDIYGSSHSDDIEPNSSGSCGKYEV